MSPTIRIDEIVFDELKKHAEPFVDTPNSVLRRLLGLPETGADSNGAGDLTEDPRPGAKESRTTRNPRQRRPKTRTRRTPRAKTGTILPEAEYEVPMLAIIEEHGGRAASREVLDELETRIGDRLTELDRQELASGDVRWRNRAQFVRLRLVEQGDMVKDSPRGMWEISDKGRARVAEVAA